MVSNGKIFDISRQMKKRYEGSASEFSDTRFRSKWQLFPGTLRTSSRARDYRSSQGRLTPHWECVSMCFFNTVHVFLLGHPLKPLSLSLSFSLQLRHLSNFSHGVSFHFERSRLTGTNFLFQFHLNIYLRFLVFYWRLDLTSWRSEYVLASDSRCWSLWGYLQDVWGILMGGYNMLPVVCVWIVIQPVSYFLFNKELVLSSGRGLPLQPAHVGASWVGLNVTSLPRIAISSANWLMAHKRDCKAQISLLCLAQPLTGRLQKVVKYEGFRQQRS